MRRGLIKVSVIGFVLLVGVTQPAFGQYGPKDGGNAPPSPGSFRQSVSPYLAEKAASILIDMLVAMRHRRATQGQEPLDWSDMSTPLIQVSRTGEIQVYVILAEPRPEFIGQLEALGLRVELTNGPVVQGWAPADAIESLAVLDFVRLIRPPGYALHNQSGAVDTAGNSILRANEARAAFGVSGASVPIGVISNGAVNRAFSIASGDLPPLGTILRQGGGDEGTAMMEIIHDLAPGSPLLFFGEGGIPPATSLEFAAGINALAAAGARVIVDDVVLFDQPKFEDGIIAQTARNFATEGRLYVTSANNYALRHYRAQYNPVNFPVTINGIPYARHHNYAGGGTDIANRFTLPAGCQVKVFLQWNNRVGAAADDFDLALVRATDGTVLASSQDAQSGSQNAYEMLAYGPAPITQTLFIAVPEFRLSSPPSSLILDYFVIPMCLVAEPAEPFLQYRLPDASVWGQGAVSEVLSVAAVNANNPTQIQQFSARGPGLISFPTPQTRNVPNITGVDCVQTWVGQLGFFPKNPFCGTSAAAPHVAAIASLLIERAPALSSSQYRAILTGTAVDLGPPGFDFTYGFGRADAFAAVQSIGSASLVAAVLPSSRSVQVGGAPATAFATIIATGSGTAIGCSITPLTNIPANFQYQTTNPANNQVTGTPNTPVNIPAGGFQTFVIAFTPTGSFQPTDVALNFNCANTGSAPVVSGLNTLLLSASAGPVPDIVALGATVNRNGIVDIPGTNGTGFFSVATVNVGATGQITASTDTGAASLPAGITLCQTNPATGVCLAIPGTSVTTQVNANATPTFAVFVEGHGTVPFDPANNRVFMRFKDGGGVTRGATSVAVRTQ